VLEDVKFNCDINPSIQASNNAGLYCVPSLTIQNSFTTCCRLETEYFAVKEEGGVLECIQEPGDVMYIPEGWAHGILNLDDVVGYSTEFQEWDGYGGTPQSKNTKGKVTESAQTLAAQNLLLEPFNVLRAILKDNYKDKCKGCKKKQDFVARILAFGNPDIT
jgi:hypothetical protein